jgi:hypothetical protein
MGMTGTFIAVNEEQLKQIEQDNDAFWDIDVSLDNEARLDIDKTWHAIHFLLTGTDYETDGPNGKIVFGGETLGDPEDAVDYLTPAQVKEAAQALSSLTLEQLRARYDPAKMTELDLYPAIWDDGDEAWEYVAEYYIMLRDFYARAAAADRFVVRQIG